MIEQILGKPDAIKMKEAAQVAYQDSSALLEERLNAMDRLEFLVEILDNANDLKPLNLWPIIMSGLEDSDSITCQKTASIIGTALQNNEKSQLEFVRIQGIPLLLNTINKCKSPKVISKLVFSLSCKLYNLLFLILSYSASIQNCIPAWNSFIECSGINTILGCITKFASDESTIMRLLSFIRRSLEQFDNSYNIWNKNNHLVSVLEHGSFNSLYPDNEYIQDCLDTIKSHNQ